MRKKSESETIIECIDLESRLEVQKSQWKLFSAKSLRLTSTRFQVVPETMVPDSEKAMIIKMRQHYLWIIAEIVDEAMRKLGYGHPCETIIEFTDLES